MLFKRTIMKLRIYSESDKEYPLIGTPRTSIGSMVQGFELYRVMIISAVPLVPAQLSPT